jgi:flagellar basal-body rod modification protein FlgD
MSVVGIDEAGSNSQALTALKSNILGKDDFLTLLVTQLQHQDPLNPQDSTEFTAQLAQFSSLEQLGNVNDNLEYLKLAVASANNTAAVSLIGKEIIAAGNTVQLIDGNGVDCNFELAGETSAVAVNIYDGYGNFIRTFDGGALSAGAHTLKWDGKDGEGNSVPAGDYTFEVLAVDFNDQMVNATTFTTGKVTGVVFRDNIAYLVMGKLEIAIGDVKQISTNDH